MDVLDYTDPSRPPTPREAGEAVRWAHTRLRRRMLSGSWLIDLIERLERDVGAIRRDAWGVPKITANPFRTMVRELAALHLVTPEVRSSSGDPIFGALAEALRAGAVWAAMPEFQAMTLGLREYLWRLSATPAGAIHYRPVPPDLVIAGSQADTPDVPVTIRELRWRSEWGWCWDRLDISDPGQPVYRVEKFGGTDVTQAALGGDFDGDAYPYRDALDEPILPYVLYHASALRDRLWDWQAGIETVEATLDLAVLYTFLGHVLRDCSWPQRYVAGLRPAGTGVEGETAEAAHQAVVTDPATLLVLEPSADSPGQALVGQWQAGADPAAMEAVISSLANRIAVDAGLPPSDIQRMGGTARSGYAIALSNEGKRVAARRYAPVFRRYDEALVQKTAIILNRATGGNLPELGYAVIYRDLPLSPEELGARRKDVLERLEAGLLSPVDAYCELNPGTTRAQATRDLTRIAAERQTFATVGPPATAPAPEPGDGMGPGMEMTDMQGGGNGG